MNTPLIPSTRNETPAASRAFCRAAGFTLTEILVAIALIVTITAVAVTSLDNIYRKGQVAAARTFVTQEVDTMLMAYKMDTGSFPTTAQGLNALSVAPDGVKNWMGPYTKNGRLGADPFGNEFHYAYPGVHNPMGYDCWSLGPDGVDGTADDIGNWPSAN